MGDGLVMLGVSGFGVESLGFRISVRVIGL